jgi:hypothetical protein
MLGGPVRVYFWTRQWTFQFLKKSKFFDLLNFNLLRKTLHHVIATYSQLGSRSVNQLVT